MALETPPSHVVQDGRIARFGMFAGPIRDTDLRSFRLYGPLGRLRLKQWQHFAIVHPQVALTFAVVDVGYQKLGWAQLVDRRTGERAELHAGAPWLDAQVASSLFGQRSWLRSDALRIEILSDLDGGRHVVHVSGRDVRAELECEASATPLEVVLPVGRERGMWSHKVPLPASGTLSWGGRDLTLEAADTTAILDLHKAHYPRHTWWHWGTFAGRDQHGRRVGVNLTRNVVTEAGMHECALWVDGELSLLELPTFALDQEPWTVSGPGVSLRFEGDGERREDLTVGPVVSRFRQRYGRWSGVVAGHEIREHWGLAEDHRAQW